MGSQTLALIESLQAALKAKKKEFRHMRGKAYIPEAEDDTDDQELKENPPMPLSEEKDESEHEEEGDASFRESQRNFMRRKRPDSAKRDGPSIALFDAPARKNPPRGEMPKGKSGKAAD